MNEIHRAPHRLAMRSYLTGFAVSVFLSLVAFGLAYLHINSDHEAISHEILIKIVVVLALLQLAVQSIFFLHLSLREESRSKLVTYIFAICIVLFIGVGSLWIMDNLNANMTSDEIGAYMHHEN